MAEKLDEIKKKQEENKKKQEEKLDKIIKAVKRSSDEDDSGSLEGENTSTPPRKKPKMCDANDDFE